MSFDKKFCTRCEIEKELKEFYDSKYTKDKKENQCKKCRLDRSKNRKEEIRERKRLWQIKFKKENPDRAYNANRDNRYKRLYGISIFDYQNLLKQQNYKCAICGTDEIKRKAFDVDHCHTTLQVRGLLCNTCNRAIGYFKDNSELLRKAINYLEKNK